MNFLNVDELDFCKNEECFFNKENKNQIGFGPHKHYLVRILLHLIFFIEIMWKSSILWNG